MYTAATNPSAATRILVVRLSAMGDVIHALPAVASLKHSFPGSLLTWVIEPRWAPLLEGNVFVDRVVTVDRHSPGGLMHAWHALRSGHFDFAVDFQGLIKSALAASAARPDLIYGFDQSQVREKLAALCYSNRLASSSAHVVERNLDLAAFAGAGSILRTFPLPDGAPEGPEVPARFVLACPLAGWRGKHWPVERYAELAAMLRSDFQIPLFISGPADAQEALEHVPGVAFRPSSLSGLIWLTRRATAVVGIDSGPLHLAAALGKPGVAIFGPTDPARNGPYGGSVAVLRSPDAVTTYQRSSAIDPSMHAITADAVYAVLREQLAGCVSRGCGC
jgi:heptosyltransferase I